MDTVYPHAPQSNSASLEYNLQLGATFDLRSIQVMCNWRPRGAALKCVGFCMSSISVKVVHLV